MKIALVGCEIIKTELEILLEELEEKPDCYWLDEDLHNHPEVLNKKLQETINNLKDYDLLLLSYSLCGKALVNIKAVHCDLLYIHSDDCIGAFLCRYGDLAALRTKAFFLSNAWVNTRNNLIAENERAIEKYGEKRAKRIMNMMYSHYSEVVYMQTEDEVSPSNREKMRKIGELTSCDVRYMPATNEIYRDLLHCREGEYVRRLKKGQVLKFEDFI